MNEIVAAAITAGSALVGVILSNAAAYRRTDSASFYFAPHLRAYDLVKTRKAPDRRSGAFLLSSRIDTLAEITARKAQRGICRGTPGAAITAGHCVSVSGGTIRDTHEKRGCGKTIYNFK